MSNEPFSKLTSAEAEDTHLCELHSQLDELRPCHGADLHPCSAPQIDIPQTPRLLPHLRHPASGSPWFPVIATYLFC